MRIVSWNVNGLRACESKGFSTWLAGSGAEIVALQEVRALPEQLPRHLAPPEGWHAAWFPAQRKGYSGVGLLSRAPFDRVETSLGEAAYDDEGRVQFARQGRLVVVNGYFPNGNGRNRDNSRIPYKLAFTQAVFERVERWRRGGYRVLVMGDFNTAREAIDLARPRQNIKTSGFTPIEREALDGWIAAGWTDTFRHFEPGPGHYSWWSQRSGARERNVGWRIDYVFANPAAMRHVVGAGLHPGVLGSDHCPISVDLDPAILG